MPSLRVRVLVCAAAALAAACRPSTPARQRGAPDAALVAAVNGGVATMGRYDFDAAVRAFQALEDAHPASPEIVLDLAIALTNRQGEHDSAAAEGLLRSVVDQPRVRDRARYVLGLLLLYAGRESEAFPLLQATAASHGDDPYPAYFSGQARLSTAPAEALDWFTRASQVDPLLRSAHYGRFQALQRLDRAPEAEAALREFQDLETHPRAAMAELKYTRMGGLAMAVTVDVPAPPAAAPSGAVFASPQPLAMSGAAPVANGGTSVTVADIDGDGRLDAFVAGIEGPAPNAVYLGTDTGWTRAADHPLARVAGVRAALWGDLDNDGRIDVVLVGGGGRTSLWRKDGANQWRDVTRASGATTPQIDAVDGALFDADHDGDLDVFLVNRAGANELLNNNGDGTFRPIARQAGIAGDGRPSRGVAVVDLDGDRDHDLIVLHDTPPHDLFMNDRVWRYHRQASDTPWLTADLAAVVAGDRDVDGRPELYTDGPRGVERWTHPRGGAWTSTVLVPGGTTPQPHLALADLDGDGTLDLVTSRGPGWTAYRIDGDGATPLADGGGAGVRAWALAAVDPGRGPSILAATPREPLVWAPGPGRFPFVSLAPTGRDSRSDQRRSNVSGIGTILDLRVGSRWTRVDTARLDSGPGQGLQPVAIGLGGAAAADFVALTWSDGVYQTEVGLDGGRLHRIEETQRQLSSCPVLFAFDGTSMRFVTDLLGVGGIGFLERPGVYGAPVPRERILLPPGSIAARDGRYQLVIGEPMEEITYLDRVSLRAYDLPPGWRLALDERKAIAGPAPTGAPIFFQDERVAVRAVDGRGKDVTALLRDADLQAAPPGDSDPRFIGRTAPHALELRFDRPIDHGPGQPVLVLDGWVEYPYAQTVFAAWQAGVTYDAPSLDAQDGSGRWHVVADAFGYPAGMPRRMALPLPALPAGTTALRLRTTQEIYWDRAAVVYAAPLPAAIARVAPLRSAVLRESGFARRTTGAQRTPQYDYARRLPLFDTRHPRGWYTAFGPIAPLLESRDDAVAIFGPGEDVALEFDAPPGPPPGWTRYVVVDAEGWCKDMDLYTRDGETVAPLPGAESAARRRLHTAFNTRYDAGR